MSRAKPEKTFFDMPKIHDCLQGSTEWLRLRLGRVTASELGRIVDTKFEQRTGEGPKTFLYEKVAEAFRGEPLPGFGSWETDQGKELEDEARRWVGLEFSGEHTIKNVGFIETDDATFGCSPDALMDDDGGLELKCPQPANHCRYFLEDRVPPDYVQQVHGCLFATGRQWWKFVSYRRRFPAFVITIQRDEAICARIKTAVETFHDKLTKALAKLRE